MPIGRIVNTVRVMENRDTCGGAVFVSLQADPSNYSAHRLLADSYGSRPRYEIARVSELLQAQLLQPLSITPVQPQLAESNLLIPEGAGPGSASFNEFNPLFARNRVTAKIDGLAGDNSTWGEEITLSGIYNRISGSVGQYHYETDGFRDNNDLDQDIYGGIVQAALTPKVNVQAEYRNRADNSGDLSLFWDLDDPDTSLRRDRETETLRTGLHLKPWVHSDIIASLIYLDRNYDKETSYYSIEDLDEGFSGEIQYLTTHWWTLLPVQGITVLIKRVDMDQVRPPTEKTSIITDMLTHTFDTLTIRPGPSAPVSIRWNEPACRMKINLILNSV